MTGLIRCTRCMEHAEAITREMEPVCLRCRVAEDQPHTEAECIAVVRMHGAVFTEEARRLEPTHMDEVIAAKNLPKCVIPAMIANHGHMKRSRRVRMRHLGIRAARTFKRRLKKGRA
jgi:hypothetical protein